MYFQYLIIERHQHIVQLLVDSCQCWYFIIIQCLFSINSYKCVCIKKLYNDVTLFKTQIKVLVNSVYRIAFYLPLFFSFYCTVEKRNYLTKNVSCFTIVIRCHLNPICCFRVPLDPGRYIGYDSVWKSFRNGTSGASL